MASLQKGSLVLDSGCGIGTITIECAKRGFFAVGVDFSEAAVKIAKNLSHRLGIADHCEIICADVQHLPFVSSAFDTILAVDLVEHLYQDQYKNALKEWFTILKNGGRIIIYTDNPSFLGNTQWSPFQILSKLTSSVFLEFRSAQLNKKLREHRQRFDSLHVDLKSATYLSSSLQQANYEILGHVYYYFDTFLRPKYAYLVNKIYDIVKARPIIGPLVDLFFCAHIGIVGKKS